MKLLHKLMQRRDEALANARKYQEMIALLEGDPSLTRGSVLRADAIADQALALHAASNGNGHAKVTRPSRYNISPAQKKANSRRMKKLWKEKRAMMMAGVKKGAAARIANNRRSAEA